MNDYSALRKTHKAPFLAVISLALCVAVSAAMLFSRLAPFSREDTRHYIPLTQSSGSTTVTAADSALSIPYSPWPVLTATPILTADWFQTYDENTVWSGETAIEIFRISYDNDAGELTVHSENGQKLLAPGTRNSYQFALKNTGTHPVKFTMDMQAYFSDGTHVIPVEAQVSDHEGNYLCGSQEAFAPVLELNQVEDSGSLRPGYIMPYTLQWRWPFEGDDTYDTLLGNLAVAQDISLTIVIRTTASYTPEGTGGLPQTGDASHIGLMLALMVGSGTALLLLLIPRRKREGEYA